MLLLARSFCCLNMQTDIKCCNCVLRLPSCVLNMQPTSINSQPPKHVRRTKVTKATNLTPPGLLKRTGHLRGVFARSIHSHKKCKHFIPDIHLENQTVIYRLVLSRKKKRQITSACEGKQNKTKKQKSLFLRELQARQGKKKKKNRKNTDGNAREEVVAVKSIFYSTHVSRLRCGKTKKNVCFLQTNAGSDTRFFFVFCFPS